MPSLARSLAVSTLSLTVVVQSTKSSIAETLIAPQKGEAKETSLVFEGSGLSGIQPSIAAALVTNFKTEELSFRGAKEADIFRNSAPAVVMVATDSGGIGSGSMISPDGKIITNWHVVEGEDEVAVIFFPEKSMPTSEDYVVVPALVTATDETRDLALVQLASAPPNNAKIMSMGEIENLQVGDDTHAIGHPHSYSWTYTKGYVSSLRPTFKWTTESGVKHVADVIQTQTPISPGNSGGPLLNDNGDMIGINSFKSDGQALNFAVSIDEVRLFLDKAENTSLREKECEVEILFDGRNQDDTANMREFDRNCDGTADAWLIVPDSESEAVFFLFDDDQDGQPNGVVSDFDRDGEWDSSVWDTTGNGEADTEGLHADGQLSPSGYRKMS